MNDEHNSSAQIRTVGEAMDYCARVLDASSAYYGHGTDNAWDEAAHLVLSVAGLDTDCGEEDLSQVLSAVQAARLQTLLQRRIAEHVPLPYLLGHAWFAGLRFLCDERAIIPRSPIAELILNAFQPWYGGPGPARVLDLCCGGGCIGLAIAHYFPEAHVDLLDIDSAALQLAADNARLLQLEDRVTILQSDLFSALSTQRYDLIVSNPPYVDATDLATMPAEFHHEPERALGSGIDGLDITRRILAEARTFLRDTGVLIVEVGNSAPALEEAYPRVPFTWLEFEHGGDGVFTLSARELQEYSESLRD